MYLQTFKDTNSSHFSSDFRFCRSTGKSESFKDEVEQETIDILRMFESAKTFLTTSLMKMILALLSLLELDLFPVLLELLFFPDMVPIKAKKLFAKFAQLITKFLPNLQA